MTVKIGNIVLDDNLYLDGLESSKDVAAAKYTSLGGETTVLTIPLSTAGRELSLGTKGTGNRVYGFFTLEQIEGLKAIAAGGQQTTLVHHRGVFTVLIVDTSDLAPDEVIVNPDPNQEYYGSIKLIEV